MPFDGKKWTLNDAEKAKIPAYNAETVRLCLSTDEIDWPVCVDAVNGLYDAANLPRPLAVVRCSSPMMGAIVWAAAAAWWAKRGIAATRAATYAATDMLLTALDVVGHELWPEVMPALGSWYDAADGGNEWWHWPSYAAFVRDVVGFRCPEHAAFAHYESAAKSGGWRLLHPKFCIVCERPAERHTYARPDGQHVLHNESGPSIRWRCGTTAWHIHGFTVTEQVVMRPETLTLDQIHETADEDVRGIMLDRYGWTRYLAEVDAACLDYADNEIEGTKEALIDAPKVGMRRLVATCATGKVVALGVPATVRTCREARQYLNPFRNGRIVGRT